MKSATLEVTKLLDKLYNLRGSDSVVLKEMDTKKEAAEETLNRTTEEKSTLQEKIESLKKDNEDLTEQGKKLGEVLSKIDKNDYATVIERLNISFDPEALKQELDSSLPKTIDKVNKEIEESMILWEECQKEIEELGKI